MGSHLHWYVRNGMAVFGIIDASVGGILLLFVIVGCFRVLKPGRQAFHDAITGTGVFRRIDVVSTPGFTPLFQKEVVAIDQPQPAPASVESMQN